MDLFGLHAVVFWDFVTCVIPEVVALPIHVHVDRKLYQPGSAPVYLSHFICFLSDTILVSPIISWTTSFHSVRNRSILPADLLSSFSGCFSRLWS